MNTAALSHVTKSSIVGTIWRGQNLQPDFFAPRVRGEPHALLKMKRIKDLLWLQTAPAGPQLSGAVSFKAKHSHFPYLHKLNLSFPVTNLTRPEYLIDCKILMGSRS